MQWWEAQPAQRKLLYSGAVIVGGGAAVGALVADRTAVGLGVGTAIGVGLWGIGVTLYMLWSFKKTADLLPF